MDQTLVIGGSGFIGSAIQRYVLDSRLENKFVFCYNKRPDRINGGLEKMQFKLSDQKIAKRIAGYSRAIWVSGSPDHKLADEHPLAELMRNTTPFLGFASMFKGSLVLLSSQAVYYGLRGHVGESVDHVASMPYGFSKQLVENYTRHFAKSGAIRGAWIFRLSYSFGRGEKSARLVPRCAKAHLLKSKMVVFGGGKSFLNPLPVDFVAQVLVRGLDDLASQDAGAVNITNLNHKVSITVKDVVSYLQTLRNLEIEFRKSGERWPVQFCGLTSNLERWLSKWGLVFPDIESSLKNYFVELTGTAECRRS